MGAEMEEGFYPSVNQENGDAEATSKRFTEVETEETGSLFFSSVTSSSSVELPRDF